MRAVVAPGDGTIVVADRPDRAPGPGEVLVRVHGAGLNRADLLQRAGLYPPPPGVPEDIPGLEFSGVVEAVGDGVRAPAPGTAVFGIAGGGGQAERIVVPAAQCAVVPDGLDLVEAGGIPEVFVTAHDALRTQANLVAGDHVLVHAVGSGVGTAVVQVARAFGATVTGTARQQSKLDRAHAIGLDHSVLVAADVEPLTLAGAITDAGGAPDVVIDLVGGPYVTADVLAAAPRARIVLVGTLAGGGAQLPIHAAMTKRLVMFGTVLRPRSVEEKAEATRAFAREVAPMLADGRIVPVVDRTVPLVDAEAAYDLLSSDATFGKVILDTR